MKMEVPLLIRTAQFNDNEQTMVDAGSTWDDVGRIAVAIEDAAANISVDERVILGIMYVILSLKDFALAIGPCCRY